MRQGKKLFDSFKRRGEWVELLFMTVASALGFNVARPWGDSGRYDVATEHEGIFHRVQVKSTEMQQPTRETATGGAALAVIRERLGQPPPTELSHTELRSHSLHHP